MDDSLPFIPLYMLLLEHVNGNVQLAKNKEGTKIVAEEGNQHFLRYIGDGLLEENLIIGYQLVVTFEKPKKSY
jgi:hypothetical protein